MTDHVRSEISRRNRESVAVEDEPILAAPTEYVEPGIDPDDTLVLLFMCCHPALSLRAVGGLTTAEIARSFLVPEATMAERISRAKQSIESSRAARTGPIGELIPLDEQDRTLWDQEAIAEGVELATAALSNGAVGEYQLQAAIAALHDEAPRAQETDWPQIRALYGVLQQMSDNPVVALNHAIATAMVEGPRVGLALLESLEKDERLAGSHRLIAVRAHLLERAGEREASIPLYRDAAALTTSIPERNYLLMRAARLDSPSGTSSGAASGCSSRMRSPISR